MLVRSLLLITATVSLAVAADVRIVEEIVAKVNGDIITRGSMAQARQQLTEELGQQGLAGPRLAEAVQEQQKNVLRNQIDQLLLEQHAKDLNINVDPDLTRRMAQFQSDSKITDVDKFHDYVRQQTGMSYEDFRDRMKKSMLTQRVVSDEITSHIAIPEADQKKYYDEHKNQFVREEEIFLSQIVISTEGKTPEQVTAAQAKAKELVAQARKGENFADLARKNSDDVATARDGGQLPPYKRSEHLMVKEIEDLVFLQKKGYVTDPIKTNAGLVILKVDDHYEAGQATFEEVKNQIMDKLAGPQVEPKLREYLTHLREDAFLQIKDGYVDTGAAPGKDTRWQDVAQLKPETTTKEEVAARRKRRLLKIIPLPGSGKTSVGTAAPAAAPAATPAPPAKP